LDKLSNSLQYIIAKFIWRLINLNIILIIANVIGDLNQLTSIDNIYLSILNLN
jgi:hypothetical protein